MENESPNRERLLTLGFEGEAASNGVSISTLSAKLNALQALVCNLGNARRGGNVASRGSWTSQVRSACDLVVKGIHHSAYTVETELPPPDVLPGMPDLGLEAIKLLREVIAAVERRDQTRLIDLLPDSAARNRSLKSLQALCPRDTDKLRLLIGNGAGPPHTTLTGATRTAVSRLFRSTEPDDFDQRIIVGDLIEIRVNNKHHIALLVDQREIACYYDKSMEDVVSQLVAGSLVEVVGFAQLTSDGALESIIDMVDVTTVDMNPFTVSSFSWEGRRFQLKRPVVCIPSYVHNVWVYECPHFRLHAFAHDRTVALRQFNQEFALVWDGLVAERDEDLTADAIALRNRLIGDIVPTEDAA